MQLTFFQLFYMLRIKILFDWITMDYSFGRFVFNRWENRGEEIRVCIFLPLFLSVRRVLLKSALYECVRQTWLVKLEGCSSCSFSPYLLYLPVSLTFPLYFVKTFPRLSGQTERGIKRACCSISFIPCFLYLRFARKDSLREVCE